MEPNTDFGHDRFQIVAIQTALHLLDNRDDLLDDVLTCGRGHCIEIAVGLEIGLFLLAL